MTNKKELVVEVVPYLSVSDFNVALEAGNILSAYTLAENSLKIEVGNMMVVDLLRVFVKDSLIEELTVVVEDIPYEIDSYGRYVDNDLPEIMQQWGMILRNLL